MQMQFLGLAKALNGNRESESSPTGVPKPGAVLP